MSTTGWRDIETAPKDGTPGSSSRWLLLFGDGAGFMRCHFLARAGAAAGAVCPTGDLGGQNAQEAAAVAKMGRR